MTRERNRTAAPETGEEAPHPFEAATPAPLDEEATETPAPAQDAPVSENSDAAHVPVEHGKGGCYVIGEDGRRVRVPT